MLIKIFGNIDTIILQIFNQVPINLSSILQFIFYF